jgi:hypothetical protein
MKKREENYNRKVLHPLVITINLLLIFVIANAFSLGGVGVANETSVGQQASPPVTIAGNKAAVNEISPNLCVYEISKFGDQEFAAYLTFMEENFLNKSRTADLLELGMRRYEKFKGDMVGQLNYQLTSQITNAAANEATGAAQLPGLADCEAKAREYIDNAAKVLQMRAVSSSNIKQATLFVEKYKQINGKLRSLNLDMMKMVNNITTFEQKLPCYLKSCI